MIDWAYIIDRLPALGLGVVIGWGLSTMQDWLVSRFRRKQGEPARRIITSSNVAQFVIVVLVAYAAIVSGRAADESKETSDRLTSGLTCIAVTTFQVNNALVERSAGSKKQSRANVKLQKAFADFLAIFQSAQPVDAGVAGQALRDYYSALLKFITRVRGQLSSQVVNPYPSPEDLIKCLQEAGIKISLKPKSDNSSQASTFVKE